MPVGKASPTEGVLPGSIYFIVKYAGDFKAAAAANAMVSSVRPCICISMLLFMSVNVLFMSELMSVCPLNPWNAMLHSGGG